MTDYYNYLFDKYKNSLKNHKIKLSKSDTDPNKYLMLYESMNVYPIYPKPIIMPLKTKSQTFDCKIQLNNNLKIDTSEMNNFTKELNQKIIEFNNLEKQFQKYKGAVKVRRFFDYEIRDTIKNKLNNQNISNAWIKMYEILNTYDLLNTNSDTVDTFHICEHPGGFIHATKYYIKHILNKKHDFVFQSLKPESDPQIFKPDKELISKYSDKLDYGPQKGDITNKENISYYSNKYKTRKFSLITSDCGLDFSENFVGQESRLYKIFYSAFVANIGLSTNGTNYVFKLFSFNDPKTIEFLQLVCLFYEQVDLVRTLTTKSGSGENYCVCVNYNFKGNKEEIVKQLIDYISDPSNTFILNKIDSEFMDKIIYYHKLITSRRITTMDQLLFRFYNMEYVQNNQIIVEYIKNYTNYYVNYFLSFIKLNKSNKETNPLIIK